MSLLRFENLHFTYPSGVEALKGVNISVDEGECVAIIGRNGSGKTTLVKHLNGLLEPTRGRVFVGNDSTEGKEPAELAHIVGLVFQNPDDQIFSTTVWDEVAFGPKNLGLTQDTIDERVKKYLELTDLYSFKDIHPYDLTITERKLLCITSILAMEPSIVVLDEPTTAQDQIGVRKLESIIKELSKTGKTIITITHDMDFVANSFSRTIVMRQGEIILDGTTEDVFNETELLMSTYVKPSSMAILGQEINAPKTAITIPKMTEWIIEKVRNK